MMFFIARRARRRGAVLRGEVCLGGWAAAIRAYTYKSAFYKRGSVNVRFAPKPAEVLRCRELTRCAMKRREQVQQ